jgi:tetratricopeptide (TPR) repeat protein
MAPEALIDRGDEKAKTALASVLFVQFPKESLSSLGIGEFEEGLSIPVQTPGPVLKFDLGMVTPESIVTGILRVLAWKPQIAHADSYRAIATALRPGILAELSDAGYAKAMAKEWEIAEEIFLALVGLFPSMPEPLLDLALLREEHAKTLLEESQEQAAEAEEESAHRCYSKLLAMEPPFPPAFYHAAFFYVRIHRYDRALSLFTTFIGLSEDVEKIASAKKAVKKLEELGYLDATFKEAYDFIRLGDEEKGLEKALAFIERHPTVWNGWFLAGWAYRKSGAWEKGAEAFQKAILLGSREADTFNELSLCQIEMGLLGEARKSLEKALAAEPENVKIIVNLGALAFKTGKKGEALGFFRSALEIDPNDDLARQWIAKLEDSETE